MSEYDISARITYDTSGAVAPVQRATDAVAKNADETKRAAQAATLATPAWQAMGAQATQTSVGVGQFGSTVGLAGQALGKLNPALGQTVTIAGSALGAVQSLTTMGMGPLGIALGVASVAVTGITALYAAMKDRQDEARESAEKLAVALAATFQTDAEARTSRIENLRAGELAMQRELETGLRQYGETAFRERAYQIRRNIEYIQGELGRAEDANARATSTGAYAPSEARPAAAADTPTRTGRGGRRATADAAAPDTREADQQREQWAADNLARITEEMDAEAEVRSRMRALEIDEANDAKDRAIEIAQEQRDAILEIKRQEAEELAAIQTGVAGGFAVLSDAMQLAAESSGASAETQKRIMAGAALAEAVVMGALEVARAAASYPDVAGMVAHGTAAAAFGVAAVKAGMTMGGAGASGGGGGAPSAPTGGPSLSGGERERGGDTIVINWGSQGLVYAADRAQLGRDLEDMIGEGRSRLGRAA